LRRGRLAESVAAWDLALKHDQGASRDHLRLGRACATALQGEHPAATALAKELADRSPRNGDVLLNAAYVYAVASEAVRRDGALAAAARDRLAGEYTAEGLALLARANTAGAFTTPLRAGSLKTDKLLDPLRPHPPYQKLLADLEKAHPAPR
jgi:hypothetical protein